MGKMKKSVKAIIISAVSIVCVLAIVLGLVFGIKKPNDPGDNSKMTIAQRNLAKQINDNVEVKDYAITGIPYANEVSSASQLTRFGLNYYSFKSGARERFFTYEEKSDGTYDTYELTDESKHNFVQAGSTSTKVVDVNDNYVLFVSYFDVSPFATEKTRLYYSLVNYSKHGEPVEIFSFDSRNLNYYIPQDSFILKENYFKLSYFTSLDSNTGTADYNFYAYPYADSKIDYTNATSKNFVTGIKYDNEKRSNTHFDSSFVIFTEDTYKVFYLNGTGFDVVDKTIVSNDGYISKNYSIKEICENKLFITETSYVSNNDDITSTSVVTGESGGAKSYVNYSYKIYDFSKATPTETSFNIENGYAVAYTQDSTKALEDYLYISYESVDADNELTGEYLIVYYDKDFNPVIKYSASKQAEEILYAGLETFLTSNRIISVNKNVNATNKLIFADENLRYVSSQTANDKIVLKHNDTGYHGVIDINGNVLIDVEQSHYSNILDVSGDKCRVYYGNLCYIYDFETKQEEYLTDYELNATLNSNSLGLYLSDNGDETYSLKDYNKNNKISNITYVNTSPAAGVTFIEVSTQENKKANKLIVIADKDKLIEHGRVTKVVYMGDSSNNATPVSSAETYATSVSSDYFNLSITQEQNPTMTLTMKNSWLIDDMNFYLHFFNDYTLHMYDMYLIENHINVTWTYGGDYISHNITLNSDGNLKWTMQFSYTNWFGYSGVGIENAEGDLVRNLYYVYFLIPDKTAYSSSLNYFHDMTLFLTSYSGVSPYCDALSGVSITAPPTSVNTRVNTCYISSWRYYGTSSTAYTNLAPDDFNTTSNVPASGSISGASVKTAASPGDTFTFHTRLWYNSCHYYAYYIRNTVKVEKDYQGYGTDATTSYYVTETVSLSAPNNRPGYDWTGWKLGSSSKAMENITHKYQWYSAESSYTDFTGTYDKTLSLPSGAATSSILRLQTIRNSAGTVYVTPTWKEAVYTITLNNSGADLAMGTSYIYEKYNTGIYFDSSCSSPYVTNSTSSKIALPDKTDYSFAGYFTKENGLGKMLIDPTGVRTADFKNTIFTANTTIYAYWTNVQYTIRYDNGYLPGTANFNQTTISCYYGKVYTISLPVSNARPGYTFVGWTITGLDGQCTHYYGTTPVISELTAFTGTVVGVSVTLDGNITHFYNLRTSEGEVVMVTRWVANTYKVSFNLDGGTARGDIANFEADGSNYAYYATYDTPFVISTTSQPTKTGYNFAGWTVEYMEVINDLDHTFTGSGISTYTTKNSSATIGKSYTNFLNLRQTDYSVDNTKCVITARWEEITYFVQFSLNGGSWSGTEGRTIIGKNESGATATPISMSAWFSIPAPANAPLGYKFESWSVTSNYDAGYEEVEDYTGVAWQYRKLSVIQDAVVVLTVNWQPITYLYHFEEGAPYVTLNNTDGQVLYDSTFTPATPQRTGFLFRGWALTMLSDECIHYVGATSFSSLSGSYVDPTNPNEFIPVNGALKNLHCEEGAEVTLTPMWEYQPYDLTYHYVTDAAFGGSIPTETQVNTISSFNSTKVHEVKIDNFFTTLNTATSEYINDGIVLPTGYRLVGWAVAMKYSGNGSHAGTLTGTSSSYSRRLDFGARYKLSLDFIVENLNGAPSADAINSVVISEFHAYAVYEPVDITLKLYAASSESGYNEISSYSQIDTINVTYRGSFTIADSKLGDHGIGLMLSVNDLIGGTTNHEVSVSILPNGVSLGRGQMSSKAWGLPNTAAYNPNDPVFYLYVAYCKPEPEKVLTFAYNSKLGGYTVTGYDYYEFNRQSVIYGFLSEFEIPSTYDDGEHGSAPVVAIGTYAFSGLPLLGCTLIVPSSIRELGSYAFSGLTISNITGGSGIETLDFNALSGSSSAWSIWTNVASKGSWVYYDYRLSNSVGSGLINGSSAISVSTLFSYSAYYLDYGGFVTD